ncbi:MAG: TolC family protein [Pseudomonadota bacterium]
MKFHFGRLPVYLITCVVASTLVPITGFAADYPLTLSEAERLALGVEPGQQELLAYADAFEREADAADRLPDPTMRVGLSNFPVGGGGFSAEAMTQAQVGFRQAFPRRAIRAASANRFRALALARRADADARGLAVLESARRAWLDIYFWQRTTSLLHESKLLFGDLVRVTESLYAEGRRTQHDVLRAQLELSRIDDRLLRAAEAKAAAQARLSEWLGQDAYRPVAKKLPDWTSIPPLQALQQALRQHPAVQAADENIAAGDAGVTSAREQRKPGWALDVGYGFRDGFMPDGMQRSDMVSVNVVVDLPFFGRARQDSKLAAALGNRSAAVSAKNRLIASLESQLRAEHARWNELSQRLELFQSSILLLSDEQAGAALSAYRSDAGDFADVTRSYVDALDARIEYTKIQVEHAQSFASLAALGGLSR